MPAKCASKQAAVLPNELWLEIFNKIDTNSLLDLTLVCRHWNELIFTHMADRFELNINMYRRQFPNKATNRHYRHLCFRSFRLDALDVEVVIFKQLAPNLSSLKLHLHCMVDCHLLQQLLALCTRIKELEITVEKYKKLAIRSVEIENRVSTFKSVILEMALINVQKLTIVIRNLLDLVIVESLAPRLDILMATVSCEVINKFLNIQLPALTTLDLRLKHPDRPRQIKVPFERTALQQFLLECKQLRNFVLDCKFDGELLSMIFNSLPKVRNLKLYSRLTSLHFSLSGLEKMVNLKVLTLLCFLVYQEIPPIVPMPTVEKVSLDDYYVIGNILADILRRFPNLKDLSFPIHRYGDVDLTAIVELAPRLENLCLRDLERVTPDLINDITQLTYLETLTIEADVIARENFRLLSNIIVLPTLNILTIGTSSNIPVNISRAVATKNPSCKLILNRELVQPSVPLVAVKLKRPASVTNHNPGAPSTGDESQASGSGASTSGSSSNLSVVSDMDRSNVSFSTVKCSSPTEKCMFLEVSK